MDAVITAGGRVNGAFASAAGTPVKALAAVAGKTMLERVVEAARAGGADRIAVVGGPEVRAFVQGRVERVIDERDGLTNVRRALNAWGGKGRLLYLTSDMPFVTAASLRDFITRVPEGVLAVPVCSCASFDARFPHAPPFGVRIGSERIVNGGAFIIPSDALQKVEKFAVRFFAARRSLARMALLLGPLLSVRFALGRLSIASLERHAARLLGVPAAAVRETAPELAYDIDTLVEYEYALAVA